MEQAGHAPPPWAHGVSVMFKLLLYSMRFWMADTLRVAYGLDEHSHIWEFVVTVRAAETLDGA